jgi:hypothetical protein
MNRRIALASILIGSIALGFTACGDDDDDSPRFTGQNDGTSALAPSSGEARSATDQDSAGGGGTTASLQFDRKIIFTANLSLTAEDVGATFNRASVLARANGGYIESSNFSNAAEPGRGSASLTIRVPVQNYESLLGSLRSIDGARLQSEGSNSTEVTEQYTDLSSRLRNLERTEQQYLELLGRATTINDILTVQDRLSGVREQIEQIQGRLNVLDDMTSLATVSISISPVVAKAEEPQSGAPSLASAWESSWERSLEVAQYVAAGAVVVFVAMAWLIIPLGLVLVASRRFRRQPLPPPPPAPEAQA